MGNEQKGSEALNNFPIYFEMKSLKKVAIIEAC